MALAEEPGTEQHSEGKRPGFEQRAEIDAPAEQVRRKAHLRERLLVERQSPMLLNRIDNRVSKGRHRPANFAHRCRLGTLTRCGTATGIKFPFSSGTWTICGAAPCSMTGEPWGGPRAFEPRRRALWRFELGVAGARSRQGARIL